MAGGKMSKSIHLRLEKALLKKLKDQVGDLGITAQALLRSKIAEWLSGDKFLSVEDNWSEYDKPTKKTGIHFRLDPNIFNQLEKIRKDLDFKNVAYLLRIKIGSWLAVPVFIDDGEIWNRKKILTKNKNNLFKITK